jgi:MFS family permease
MRSAAARWEEVMTHSVASVHRKAGNAQGVFLVILSTVSVAGAVLIAPILPKITQHFAADPAAHAKAILALAIPALIVALFSPLAGRLVDSFGRKSILLMSLAVYSICGPAPLFVDDLNTIILFRIGLGLAEAGVMTSSTALLGDYFRGKELERWLVNQTGTASISAIVFMFLGGVLGDISWRSPFAVFGLALVFVAGGFALIFEPEQNRGGKAAAVATAGFPWRSVGPLYMVAFLSAILFFIVPIQLPFLLTERGITSSQTIGITTALSFIAVPIGSFAYKRLSHLSLHFVLAVAFFLIGTGLTLMVGNGSNPVTFVGVMVAGFGCGILQPALLAAIMKRIEFSLRGRGTGGWQMSFFLGNFVSPIIVIALSAGLGSLTRALLFLAASAALGTCLCVVLAVTRREQASGESVVNPPA